MLKTELRGLVLRELSGRLWHTTHPNRFKSILNSGAILPEPDIPDSERWKASKGNQSFPFVRTLGGVSLFDFDQFDPDSYSERYPISSWYEFVTYREPWITSI